MIKASLMCVAVLSLAACGGGSRYSSSNAAPVFGGASPAVLPFARGPIYSACQRDNRKAASRSRCGCVQAVADRSLSSAQQKRGARYFKNPHKLQEVRQSDNPGNERFWRAWKAFGEAAVAQCQQS